MAITVFNISYNSSYPFSPLDEAVMSPVGLFENTVVETLHSMALLSPLGILKIYSCVQNKITSSSSMLYLKSREVYTTMESDKNLIVSYLRERRVKKGQFLVHEGVVSRYTNFVNEGSVRTYFIDMNGQEHIVQFVV